ncbi:MAG: protease inhibitor I42 family protein [Clostridia bacterium]|nr:protease inhibitor I42 family protein [Clostridia bacterium]
MKAKLLLLLCALLCMSGCTKPQPPLNYTAALEANITTGYEWTCTTEPSGIVTLVKSEYVPHEAEPGLVGGGGTQLFEFQGVQPGEAVVQCVYQRAWETAPIRTETIVLVVDEALNITVK